MYLLGIMYVSRRAAVAGRRVGPCGSPNLNPTLIHLNPTIACLYLPLPAFTYLYLPLPTSACLYLPLPFMPASTCLYLPLPAFTCLCLLSRVLYARSPGVRACFDPPADSPIPPPLGHLRVCESAAATVSL